MFEKYLKKSAFESLEDFKQNFEIIVPEHFNFAYDVVDEYARINPSKRAICWVNDKGETHDFTFAELKQRSDETASFFQSLGIGRGDVARPDQFPFFLFQLAFLDRAAGNFG